ncbi:MAG TPA: hypothetical protein PKA03_04955 [Tabrizicola sp.]|nr:hypothetical protein [Tabrizicola sp.]
MTTMQDDALDRLLAEAAANPPETPSALIDRVLTDALALQPAARAFDPPRPATRTNPLAKLVARFGGAPALASVSAAAVLGIALGYLQPAMMEGLASGLTDSSAEELFPTVDFLTEEG